MSEQLESLTNEKQSMSVSYESKLEKLHSELQEAKSGLAGSLEKLKKEVQAHQEVRSKWAALGKDHAKLQEELKAKVPLLFPTFCLPVDFYWALRSYLDRGYSKNLRHPYKED